MFVFSNLAISLDGKIDTKKRSAYLLGSKADHREMRKLRAKADAVLLGAGSVRSCPLAVPKVLNVLITTRLDGFRPSMKFFSQPRSGPNRKARTVIFLGKKSGSGKSAGISATKLAAFEKTCDIYRFKNGHDLMKVLKKYGVRRLLVEGGGETMWLFAKAGLINEYHVTLTPRIVGGKTAPTLVDGDGFLPGQDLKLRLKSCKRKGQELFLVYGGTGRR